MPLSEVTPDPVRIATEGALWGSVTAHGFLPDSVIVSDDAGQFNVGRHGLCWIDAERLVHKLDTFTDRHRTAQQHIRALIWWFYADLKAYRQDPTPQRKAALRARFCQPTRGIDPLATLRTDPLVIGLVRVVHGRDPRATRRALTSDGVARAGGACGPTWASGVMPLSQGSARCSEP